MLTLRMFLISGGSTCDIDAVKTSNTDSDGQQNWREEAKKITVMVWVGVEVETVGWLPRALMTWRFMT